MHQDQEPPLPNPDQNQGDPGRRSRRKTARVVCASNNEFWTTQKQFWEWAREGIVTYLGDDPLTGKFEGRREKLLVLVNHMVLDDSVPEHKAHVMKGYDYQKRRKPTYPKRPVYKRSR